jgi:hypothetical protein
MPGPLGRLQPPDFEHVEKYPIRALAAGERPKNVPVTLGIEWFPTYDTPYRGQDRKWRVRPADGRASRGGHAITLKPKSIEIPLTWWDFYDQGDMSRPVHPVDESGCTGFSASYAMSMLNRERYSGPWLYWQNKLNDEWPGTAYEGSSVRAAFENLRTQGHVRVHDGKEVLPAELKWGVSAYRWARSAEEIVAALGYPTGTTEVPWANTWGRDGYPRVVWVPVDELQRHLDRWDGEACIPTDR